MSKKYHRLVFILWGLLIFFGIAWVFFYPKQAASQTIDAVFELKDGRKTSTLSLETASDDNARQLGLMYVRDLPENRGMIFIFPTASERKFWMKNTYISLDMIFIDEKGEVVGIIENAQPLRTIPLGVGKPSKYVVELVGGVCKKLGIESGARISFGEQLPEAR